MKIPLSKRLATCAGLIKHGAKVADIGTDHGYLPIWLIKNGVCSHVYAADLREQPLQKAVKNAAQFSVSEQITFCLSDGLDKLDPSWMDTIVCAGMGGDLIIHILEQAQWLKNERYTLILQPQSSGQDLRRWLSENGFRLESETLLQEGGFFYSVIRAKFGNAAPLTPGQQFVSPAMLAENSPLLPKQLDRLIESMTKTIAGIQAGGETALPKLKYYQTALDELKEMRLLYD